ncbi:hypothetical protein [Caenimonas sp. SL110]|uniref:hypothetical protein n=1 Tax=Caenimonas sp. SL110 TaxID=1450524 RepID=UPI000A7AD4A4|nr:hypothetical protein [Caenimonas sp. SL110]
MLASQKIAVAAHVHVLLRRKTGRVTDTEWMASNAEYAMEIVRFARAKAQEDGHADLAEWADKLERVALEPTPVAHRPLAQTAIQMLKERNAAFQAAPQPPAAVQAPIAPAAPVVPVVAPSGFAHSVPFGESTGFAESILEDGKPRPRNPAEPRYVGGLR